MGACSRCNITHRPGGWWAMDIPRIWPAACISPVSPTSSIRGRTISNSGASFTSWPMRITIRSSASTQYGARRHDFAVGENKGFVILPIKPAEDGTRPWIWYAPTFIGNLPDPSHEWMFTRLLSAGFAIAGVDVGESYGNPRGREV